MVLSRSALRIGVSLLTVLAAGCGGGAYHAVPPYASTAADVTRTTEAVNPIVPVMYVAGQGSVYAYPLDAANNDPPTKVLGSEYNAADGTVVGGIATDRRGTLYVLVNFGPLTPGGPSCLVRSYSAAAPSGSPPQTPYRCSPDVYYGAGLATGPAGEVDVLDTIDNAGTNAFQVERFFPGGTAYATSKLKLKPNKPYTTIAAGAAGNIFVGFNAVGASPPRVDKYAALTSGAASPSQGIDIPNYTNLDAIAAGHGNVWLLVGATSGPQAGTAEFFVAPPTLAALTDRGGTGGYPNIKFAVGSVDISGNLYILEPDANMVTEVTIPVVGNSLNFGGETFLNAAVRRGNPAGTKAIGIAIAQ